jgi:hypothetical protein
MKHFTVTAGALALASMSVVACSSDAIVDPVGVMPGVSLAVAPPPPPKVIPLFVIGDVEAHALGDNVNFWGAQWWKNNAMSGAVSNGVAAFKGYLDVTGNGCGGTWSARPGNSSNPPDTIDADVAIAVTSSVIKDGATISGDIQQIVIVHQDGGYAGNPGHPGNGVVTAIACSQ